MEFLTIIGIFLFSILIIVGIHEFGHYLSARISGVRVLNYSIGFGKTLFTLTSPRSGINYNLKLLPLGGSVQLLMRKDVENPKSEYYEAKEGIFEDASIWNKFWVILWGPLTNGILAIVIFAYLGMGPKLVSPALLGEPQGYAQEIGFKKLDVIRSIDGVEVDSWKDFVIELSLATGRKKTEFSVLRDERVVNIEADFSFYKIQREKDNINFLSELGFHHLTQPANLISYIEKDSVADNIGFKLGDRVISVNNENTHYFYEYNGFKANSMNNIVILRGDKTISFDVLMSDSLKLGVGLSSSIPDNIMDKYFEVKNIGLYDSVLNGAKLVGDISVYTLKFMWKIINNETSTSVLSGPVSMAMDTGDAADKGLEPYLFVLAMLSVNIMVLNLLPIPALDGGHLILLFLESCFGEINRTLLEKIVLISFLVLIFIMLSISIYDSALVLADIFN